MFDNHPKISFSEFKGAYKRGNSKKVPLTHAIDAINCEFTGGGVRMRGRFTHDGQPEWVSSAFRLREVFQYFNAGSIGTTEYLISSAAGSLYFYNNSAMSSAILTIPGWDGHFHAVQVSSRIYIMPYSLSTAGLYVWNIGSSAARLAAGSAPATGPAAVSGGAGITEPGIHLISYAWETDTGFITAPSPVQVYTVASTREIINLSLISNGPAGTIAKHILVTKRILNYDGNTLGYEFFFGGKISNNTTTTFSYNKYDADLVSSADYLFDQRASIPNARGVSYYENKLVVFGLGTDRNQVIVSKPNEPESFDAVDGNILLSPKTRSGIFSVAAYHGLLYIFSTEKTFGTQDNDDVPSTWKVVEVDSGTGIATFPFPGDSPSRAIAQYRGVPGTIDDFLVISTNTGVRLFNGTYGPELSFNIASAASFDQYDEVFVDPINKRIHVRQSSTPTDWWVGDFRDGLTPENIKWSNWSISQNILEDTNTPPTSTFISRLTMPTSVLDDNTYLWTARWRYRYDTANSGTDGGSIAATAQILKESYAWIYQFPYIGAAGWINNYTGIVIDCKGVSLLVPSERNTQLKLVYWELDSFTGHALPPNIFLTEAAVSFEKHRMLNIVSDGVSIELEVDGIFTDPLHEFMGIHVNRVDIYYKPLWRHRAM